MGILIRNKNEQISLEKNQNIYFLGDELLNLIKELIETIEKYNQLEQRLKNQKHSVSQSRSKLQELIDEQKRIDSEIQALLNSKKIVYEELKKDESKKTLIAINQALSNLFGKTKHQDFLILQTSTQIRHNSRAIDNANEEIQKLGNKIKLIKELLQIEYDKADWDKLRISTINLPYVFTIAKNHDLGILLNSILRKNFNLEKLIIQMINKLCIKILNTNNYQNINYIFEQISVFCNVRNMIYVFVYELISSNNLPDEMIPLLQQLDNFLDIVSNYAKNSLNKNRSLDISNPIMRLKSVSELNRKKVINDCRPRIFYKKKLKIYNFSHQKINEIMDEMSLYLKSLEPTISDGPKTYSLK